MTNRRSPEPIAREMIRAAKAAYDYFGNGTMAAAIHLVVSDQREGLDQMESAATTDEELLAHVISTIAPEEVVQDGTELAAAYALVISAAGRAIRHGATATHEGA